MRAALSMRSGSAFAALLRSAFVSSGGERSSGWMSFVAKRQRGGRGSPRSSGSGAWSRSSGSRRFGSALRRRRSSTRKLASRTRSRMKSGSSGYELNLTVSTLSMKHGAGRRWPRSTVPSSPVTGGGRRRRGRELMLRRIDTTVAIERLAKRRRSLRVRTTSSSKRPLPLCSSCGRCSRCQGGRPDRRASRISLERGTQTRILRIVRWLLRSSSCFRLRGCGF
mmetsp:Transcript_52882/g.114329  ORF Transcript_52882/g.114329 Transcript_52882/m.114329 type:complete len:223 (+) Transcript_52882:861-1529(+)